MVLLVILSFLILAAFVGVSISKTREIPESYSSLYYSYKDSRIKLFSLVTCFVAGLLLPPMIEAGEGSNWQFLGFFTPVYLVMVALAPDYKAGGRVALIHTIGASLCAVASLGWLIALGVWWIPIIFVVIGLMAMGWTESWQSWLFWCEMVGFASIYTALLILI